MILISISYLITIYLFAIVSLRLGFLIPQLGNYKFTDNLSFEFLAIFQKSWFFILFIGLIFLYINWSNFGKVFYKRCMMIAMINIPIFLVNLFLCMFYYSFRSGEFHPT